MRQDQFAVNADSVNLDHVHMPQSYLLFIPEQMHTVVHCFADNNSCMRFDRKLLNLTAPRRWSMIFFTSNIVSCYLPLLLLREGRCRSKNHTYPSLKWQLQYLIAAVYDVCFPQRVPFSFFSRFRTKRSSVDGKPLNYQARFVNSVMKISHPFAKRIGASALII